MLWLIKQALGQTIPEFTLCRRVQVGSNVSAAETKLSVSGLDFDGTPASNFQAIRIDADGAQHSTDKEPFAFTFKTPASASASAERKATVTLESFGHFGEHDTSLTVSLPAIGARTDTFDLRYSPVQHKWEAPVAVKAEELKLRAADACKAVVRDLKGEMRKMMLAKFDPSSARVVMRQIAGADLGEFFEKQFRDSVKDEPASVHRFFGWYERWIERLFCVIL